MLKNKYISLKVKILLVIIFSILCAGAALYFIQLAGNSFVDNYYMSEGRYMDREQKLANEFELYIKKNEVLSTDQATIKEWCHRKGHVYIIVENGRGVSYSTNGSFENTYETSTDDGDYDVYMVRFKDGMHNVSLMEYSEEVLYEAVWAVGALIAALIIIGIILNFLGSVVTRITHLSKETNEIKAGALRKKIVPLGNDEISTLGKDINDMRESIIAHFEGEQRALNANYELITSMSHDIRTPLTTIIGYSEMMADDDCTDIEELKLYAKACNSKASQLKNMTDTLFQYFLIYGESHLETDIQKYEASVLLQQLIGENIIYLEQMGYTIEAEDINENFEMHTDAVLLRRVFDNVFSNINKYADKNCPVIIKPIKEEGFLTIKISNRTFEPDKRAESTKLGLKTCEKIMETLGGEFSVKAFDEDFTAEIVMAVD